MKLFDSFFKHALIRINKRNIIYLNATRCYCNNINYNALINFLNKKNDINKEINALYSLLERLSNYKYEQYKEKLTLKNNIKDEITKIKIQGNDKNNNINIENDMNISQLDHNQNGNNNNNYYYDDDYKKLIYNWKYDKIKIFISWSPEIIEDKYKSKCFSIPTYITFHIVISNNDIKLNNILYNSYEYDNWNFNKIIQTINNHNNLKDKENAQQHSKKNSQQYIRNFKKGESDIPSYDFKESSLEKINEQSQLNHSMLSDKKEEHMNCNNNNIHTNYNNDEHINNKSQYNSDYIHDKHIEEEEQKKTKKNKKSCIVEKKKTKKKKDEDSYNDIINYTIKKKTNTNNSLYNIESILNTTEIYEDNIYYDKYIDKEKNHIYFFSFNISELMNNDQVKKKLNECIEPNFIKQSISNINNNDFFLYVVYDYKNLIHIFNNIKLKLININNIFDIYIISSLLQLVQRGEKLQNVYNEYLNVKDKILITNKMNDIQNLSPNSFSYFSNFAPEFSDVISAKFGVYGWGKYQKKKDKKNKKENNENKKNDDNNIYNENNENNKNDDNNIYNDDICVDISNEKKNKKNKEVKNKKKLEKKNKVEKEKQNYLSFTPHNINNLQDIKKLVFGNKRNISDITEEDNICYSISRNCCLILLFEYFINKLEHNFNILNLYIKVEQPLILCISHIEKKGIFLNQNKIEEIQKKSDDPLIYKNEIEELCKCNINLNSSKQVSSLIYKQLLDISISTDNTEENMVEDVDENINDDNNECVDQLEAYTQTKQKEIKSIHNNNNNNNNNNDDDSNCSNNNYNNNINHPLSTYTNKDHISTYDVQDTSDQYDNYINEHNHYNKCIKNNPFFNNNISNHNIMNNLININYNSLYNKKKNNHPYDENNKIYFLNSSHNNNYNNNNINDMARNKNLQTNNKSLKILVDEIEKSNYIKEKEKEKLKKIIKNIKLYRESKKLVQNYIENLPKYIQKNTNKIHCNFNQIGASTGRLSCDQPNLQNIHSRFRCAISLKGKDENDTHDNNISHIHMSTNNMSTNNMSTNNISTSNVSTSNVSINNVSPNNISPHNISTTYPLYTMKKKNLITFDYKQMELFVMAYLSFDEQLLKLLNYSDVFIETAKVLFNTNDVTNELRRMTKTVIYGILYGQTENGLAKSLLISDTLASNLIENFFQFFPNVYRFMKMQKFLVKHMNCVYTLIGRKRIILPNIKNKYRISMNTPIQGCAADIMKFSLLSCFSVLNNNIYNNHKLLKMNNINPLMIHKNQAFLNPTNLILQVHDELLLESEHDATKYIIQLLNPILENAFYNLIYYTNSLDRLKLLYDYMHDHISIKTYIDVLQDINNKQYNDEKIYNGLYNTEVSEESHIYNISNNMDHIFQKFNFKLPIKVESGGVYKESS
ncbi:DNA polymerase 1, putative [Plasmodium sp. gorilla clade G2]|uniref:DNA polymerase 1, putative n=1 Tax=Plasmodium sp. gorilla clade G2 TaxID=880535 RepID=UPI000D22CC3C|nr:DNA polymerase 1, putative [Plasmodium sp. gorilla clade G2]SOV12662.1 DNA polymerase 1, putative [Plasmodium sp. gorilla clade G2]